MFKQETKLNLLANKINYLEGIRGIAAFMVLAHHFMLAFYPAAYDHNPARAHTVSLELNYYASPLNVLTNGNFCVTIFFVLSGFVLSHKYMRENNFSIIISAAKRRFFRLFIPVGFVIIIAFILLHFQLYKHVEVAEISKSDWWLKGLWPVPATFGWFFEFFTYRVMFLGDSNCDTSMWTMSMELYGSFLVFGLLAATHYTKRKNIIFLISLIILYAMQKYYYLAFVLGMMLNRVENFSLKTKSASISYLLVPFLIFGGLLLGSFPSLEWSHYSFWEFIQNEKVLKSYVTIHVIGSMMVVAGVVMSPLLQKILSNKYFVFLGLISFSLYLIHPLIIGAFSCPLFLRLHDTMGYNRAALTVFLSTIALTVILSWLMAKTVDKFSVDFSKRIFGGALVKKKISVKSKGNKK